VKVPAVVGRADGTAPGLVSRNFRYADLDAERSCQYHLPESLSATDSTVVVIRKVLAEYARGAKQPDELGTREEELVTALNLEVAEEAQSVHADRIREGLAQTGMRQN
jgi:hypothetical protein